MDKVSDLISRQAAIDIAMQYCQDDDGSCSKSGVDIREMLDELESLPSAEPERTQFDCDMAYMQGKTDGIRECTEQLRKLKIKMEVEHDT